MDSVVSRGRGSPALLIVHQCDAEIARLIRSPGTDFLTDKEITRHLRAVRNSRVVSGTVKKLIRQTAKSTYVLDSVIRAPEELNIDCHQAIGSVPRRIIRRKKIEQNVILATEPNALPVPCQPDPGLPTKETTERLSSGRAIKPIFENEYNALATTKVFDAANAPTCANGVARSLLESRPRTTKARVTDVLKADSTGRRNTRMLNGF